MKDLLEEFVCVKCLDGVKEVFMKIKDYIISVNVFDDVGVKLFVLLVFIFVIVFY